MPKSVPRLYLASQSPRRKQLLETLGIPFEVVVAHTEEAHPETKNLRKIILSNSLEKAKAAAKIVNSDLYVILAADTLVVLDDKVLGKPKDKNHAIEMLKHQSGKVQKVFTGMTLYSPKWGTAQNLVESRVHFRLLSSKEIENYTDTIEPYDKAGAYAVQGIGAVFIDKIEGSYTNVMGLPIEAFLKDLEAFTQIPLCEWIPKRPM